MNKNDIISAVEKVTGVTLEEIQSYKRSECVSDARIVLAKLLRYNTDISEVEIAETLNRTTQAVSLLLKKEVNLPIMIRCKNTAMG